MVKNTFARNSNSFHLLEFDQSIATACTVRYRSVGYISEDQDRISVFITYVGADRLAAGQSEDRSTSRWHAGGGGSDGDGSVVTAAMLVGR